MSVKKQVPSFCKMCSFYEEVTEELLDEHDVDSFLTHILDNSQSQNGRARVSKASFKNLLQSSSSNFCYSKTQHRFILQRGKKFFKKKTQVFVDSLRDSLKTSDEESNFLQFSLPKPKIKIGLTKSKGSSCAYYYEDNIEHPNRFILLSFWYQNNNSCVFFHQKVWNSR